MDDLPLSKAAQARRQPREARPLRRRRPGQPAPARASRADAETVERFRGVWNAELAGRAPAMGAVTDPRMVAELADGVRAYAEAEWRAGLRAALADPWYRERLSPRFGARMMARLLLEQKPAPEEKGLTYGLTE
jgi:hypothetical protein